MSSKPTPPNLVVFWGGSRETTYCICGICFEHIPIQNVEFIDGMMPRIAPGYHSICKDIARQGKLCLCNFYKNLAGDSTRTTIQRHIDNMLQELPDIPNHVMLQQVLNQQFQYLSFLDDTFSHKSKSQQNSESGKR